MNDQREESSFQARQMTNQIFKYRPHLLYIYKAYNVLGAIALVTALTTGFVTTKVIFVLPFLFLTAVFFLSAFFILKPFALTKFKLTDNSIEMTKGKKTISFKYSEITKVKFSYIPYIGGWFLVCGPKGKKIRLTVVVEKSELILESLFSQNPELVPENKLLNYRRTAIYSDHSWARIYDLFKSPLSIILSFFVNPLLCIIGYAIFFKVIGTNLTLTSILAFFTSAFLVNFFAIFITYQIKEIYFAITAKNLLKKYPNKVTRDIELELSIGKNFSIARHILFYGIAITFLYFKVN